MAVLRLFLRGHLAERPPCLGDQEHRVVAETGNAPPLRDDLAPALALKKLGRTARRRKSDRAREPRQPRARMTSQPIQQDLRALFLSWADAGRVNARVSLQHVDLDSRVVADRRQIQRG